MEEVGLDSQANEPQNPQDELLENLIIHNPDAFNASASTENEQLLEEARRRDAIVEGIPLLDILSVYGIDKGKVQLLPDNTVSVQVVDRFDPSIILPYGYVYKGGAARALLLRSFGIDSEAMPRDTDLARIGNEEPYKNADIDMSNKFMKDDYEFGNGVEVMSTKEEYFQTRDFTINELYATDSEIIATQQCIVDTIRGIIRLTDFERSQFNGPGPKMLAKMLRMYAEAALEGKQLYLPDLNGRQISQNFIAPFWLAVQLDRSFQRGEALANQYIKTLIERGQLPDSIQSATVAADYLVSCMDDRGFYFRNVPKGQHEMEEEWVEEYEEYEQLFGNVPKFRGHGKSRGDK